MTGPFKFLPGYVPSVDEILDLGNLSMLLSVFDRLHPTGPVYEAMVAALDQFVSNNEEPEEMLRVASNLLDTLNNRHAAMAG